MDNVTSPVDAALGAGAWTPPVYGGFWHRFLALIIDVSVMFAGAMALLYVVAAGLRALGPMSLSEEAVEFVGSTPFQVAVASINYLIPAVYDAGFSSSRWQATPGKRVLGLMVTDENGRRISFLRATGRHFAKYLSGIAFVGFIIQPFTEKRQALHDKIAGTLIVRR